MAEKRRKIYGDLRCDIRESGGFIIRNYQAVYLYTVEVANVVSQDVEMELGVFVLLDHTCINPAKNFFSFSRKASRKLKNKKKS